MPRLKKKFNVLEYDFCFKRINNYDVLPYFRDQWKCKKYNFDKDKVKDKNTLKEWIERASRYMYWARCEYEFLMAPWPYIQEKLEDDLIKIDVHQQIMMNIDVIADILFEEFKIDKNKNKNKKVKNENTN